MADSFDKSSTLNIDGEVLNRSSFKKTAGEKLARRIGNEADDPLFVFEVAPAGTVSVVEYSSISSLASGSLTDIISYTVPIATTLTLAKIEVSGTNVAEYQVDFSTVLKGIRRTYWGHFNSDFEFKDTELVAGTVVRVRVIHARPMTGDFNATILGSTV